MPDQNTAGGHPGQPTVAPGQAGVHVTQVSPTATPASGPTPEPAPHNLQDVLPEINRLAQRVGGLDKLAELIQTLRGART